MSTSNRPLGVHLVGSICGVNSTSESFQKCAEAFPNRLRRLPDGEPATRNNFMGWQASVFEHTPTVLRKYNYATFETIPQPIPSPTEVDETVKSMPPLKPRYDDYALESYAEFNRLRENGVVPKGIKFQVCLPTVFCVMGLIRPGFQAAIEPIYTEALLGCLRRIEAEIPREDLAIQWDIAGEPMVLEKKYWPHFEPWWEGDEFLGCAERLTALVNSVSSGVDVGMHICYGDWGHRHFVQPKDTGLMVKLANAVLEKATRSVNWIHLPVPKDRDDEAYFTQLQGLSLREDTELHLGLVHAHDEEGSKRRATVARSVLGETQFGVATECGLGRTPAEDFDSIAGISEALSSPVL